MNTTVFHRPVNWYFVLEQCRGKDCKSEKECNEFVSNLRLNSYLEYLNVKPQSLMLE